MCFFYHDINALSLGFFGESATPYASPSPWPSIFSNYSFLVRHTVNWDDRHLLAHAMASDFKVAWQYSQREQLLRIKLNALI
jgi:hypothetical protein